MKKVLHFNIFKTIPKGVLNQIIDEQTAVEEINKHVHWDIKLFSHDTATYPFQESVVSSLQFAVVKDLANYMMLRKEAYDWLASQAISYDAILLRYRPGDIFAYLKSKRFGRYFTIHHTMEVPEAKTRKFPLNLIEAGLERYLGYKVLERSSGIIGVTPEIIDYELSRLTIPKPTFCHPNGIDLQRYQSARDRREGIPKLLLVASVQAPWHGIDLLVAELNSISENFKLHILGNITSNPIGFDKRIVYHGVKDDNYIMELASECDVGLSSFALFRKNMREACPLKVRQYLSMGLPVYSGHKDSGLPDDFPYYINGCLNAESLLEYARNMRMVNRETVRSAAYPYIDKRILMRKLISWIDSVD